MIELIANIGKQVRQITGETPSLVDLWVKDNSLPTTLFFVDIDSITKGVDIVVADVYDEVFTDSLIYASGNSFTGSGLVLDSSHLTGTNLKKLNDSLKFLELATPEDFIQSNSKASGYQLNLHKLQDIDTTGLVNSVQDCITKSIKEIVVSDGKLNSFDFTKLLKEWLIDNLCYSLLRVKYLGWSESDLSMTWVKLREQLLQSEKANKKLEFSTELHKELNLYVKEIKAELRKLAKDTKKGQGSYKKAESSPLGFKIKEAVESKITELGIKPTGKASLFCIFRVDGKLPRELFEDKFCDLVEKAYFKPLDKEHKCHECGCTGELYPTITYACFTNDRGSYTNVGEDGVEYGICKECLYDILVGRKFVAANLTGYWCGSSVMFLPYNLDEISMLQYNANNLIGAKSQKLIEWIGENETFVLEELSKVDSLMDIVFYEVKKSAWNIKHTIKGVNPSRFSVLAKALNSASVVTHNDKKLKMTTYAVGGMLENDKISYYKYVDLLDKMLLGNPISRTKFLAIALKGYRSLKDKGETAKAHHTLDGVHRLYHVMYELGCIRDGKIEVIEQKEGVSRMINYSSVEDFFGKNKSYFDNDVKKAWFLLGTVYKYVVEKGKKEGFISLLEKSFITGRTFNDTTFKYISNTCVQQLVKYKAFGVDLRTKLADINHMMVNCNRKTQEVDAMHCFFWGLEVYIPYASKEENEELEK